MKIEVVYDTDKLTEDKHTLIKKVLLAADIDISNCFLVNIRFYETHNNRDLYIVFGKKALWGVRLIQTENIIKFPDLSLLNDIPTNEKSRQEAFVTIEILKNKLKVNNISEIDQLPDITTEKLLVLLEQYRYQNGITLATKDNSKTIRISFNTTDNEKADLKIMFHELVAIKLANEIFGDSFNTIK